MPTPVVNELSGTGEVDRLPTASMQEVFATLYRNLGINVASTTIPDNNGRPQYLVDRHDVINELV